MGINIAVQSGVLIKPDPFEAFSLDAEADNQQKTLLYGFRGARGSRLFLHLQGDYPMLSRESKKEEIRQQILSAASVYSTSLADMPN